MAKTNYSYEKRQKEIAKKKKQEEKRQRKIAPKDEQSQEDLPKPDFGSILSPIGLYRRIKDYVQHRDDDLGMSPLYDRGGPTGVYRGPSGPIGKLARIDLNHRLGRPPEEGLGDKPFSRVEK